MDRRNDSCNSSHESKYDSLTSSCDECSSNSSKYTNSVSCSSSIISDSLICTTTSFTDCSSSCCSYTSDSQCDCVTDSTCYDPDRLELCPDDCPKKCEGFNIYWFGSSLTDTGNGRLNLGLEPYSKNVENLGECGEVESGLGPCGRASDGKVYPEYVAEDLCMELERQYDLLWLPKTVNNLVSFSMVGAKQVGNVTPLTPNNEYGYKWQVDKYIDLYHHSDCYSYPEEDIFMYTDVGYTEFLEAVRLILAGELGDPTNYFNDYADQAYQNIFKLYNVGKARKMFVQLVDAGTIFLLPAYDELECALLNTNYPMEIVLSIFEAVQNNLREKLRSFASSQPHFDLTILTTLNLYDNLITDAESFGIVNDGNTMLDLGWPEKVFENQLWFDDFHLSSHSNRVLANYVKTWFQQKVCPDC